MKYCKTFRYFGGPLSNHRGEIKIRVDHFENVAKGLEVGKILPNAFGDALMLDFDDDLSAIKELSPMYLSNRRTCDGNLINALEDGAQGSLQLYFDQLLHEMEGSRGQGILASRQALQVCIGHDVSA